MTGAEAALPAWVDFMKGAIAVRPDLGGQNFECPDGIKFVEIDSATGLIGDVKCPLRELIAVTEAEAPHSSVIYTGICRRRVAFAEVDHAIAEDYGCSAS